MPAAGPDRSRVDRLLGSRLDARDAAVGHHDAEPAADALLLDRAREPLQVAAGLRPDERVHARGREALELAELREDVGARSHERAGNLLGDDLRGPALVLGVEVGEEEADRDRLDAVLSELACDSPHVLLVERLEDLARRRHDPLDDDLPMAPLDERPRLPGDVLHDRVVLRALVAADVDDVAKAARRHEPGHRAVVLEHRVGRDRRSVEDGVDLGRPEPTALAELRQAGRGRAPGSSGVERTLCT